LFEKASMCIIFIECCPFIKLIIQRTKIPAHKLFQSMTPKVSIKKNILIGQKKVPRDFFNVRWNFQ
jgi:hypothetical protein